MSAILYVLYCTTVLLYPDLKSIMLMTLSSLGFDLVWVLYVCLFTTFNSCTNSAPHYENYNYILLFSGVFWMVCVIVGSLYVLKACKFQCKVLMMFSCRLGWFLNNFLFPTRMCFTVLEIISPTASLGGEFWDLIP